MVFLVRVCLARKAGPLSLPYYDPHRAAICVHIVLLAGGAVPSL